MKFSSKRAGAIAARKRAKSSPPSPAHSSRPATPPPKAQPFSPPNLLLWGIAAFAFLIRIPNLKWGLPELEEEAFPVHKSFEMWGWDQGRVTLDPQTANWPALSFYIHLAWQHIQYAFGKITGRYADRLDFFVEHVDVSTLMPAARFLSLIVAVAVVVIGARLAQRLTGWYGALITGLVLSLSPLLIEHSIKVTPDIFLTLFSALALGSFFDVYEKGRWRDYVWSGVWIGLGAASKYTPVLLIPCLLAAHLARQRPAVRWRRWLDRRLLLAGATCAVAFLFASPYTLLNLATAKRDVSSQFTHVVTSGHFGYELQLPGHLFYLVKGLPDALGWPALVLGLTGLILAAWHRRGLWLLVLIYFACYYLGLGALRSLYAHYMLPALLPLALGVAGLASELRRMALARQPRWAFAMSSVLLVLVLAPLAVQSTQQSRRYSRPTTFQEAKRFILQELNRPGVTFACENGGPALPRSPEADFSHRPVFRRLDEARRKQLLSRPAAHRFEINMYQADANGSDLYYDLRHYLNYDYIVVSGTTYHRYVGLAADFPRQNEFYQDLQRYCELVRHFSPTQDRLGTDVWIYHVGPKTKAIVEERGALTPGFHDPYMSQIRLNDLHSFLGFTGDLATRREDWKTADLYLGTLLEFRPEIRKELLLTVAYVKYKSGNSVEAAKLCAEFLKHRPGDPKATALAAALVEEARATVGNQ